MACLFIRAMVYPDYIKIGIFCIGLPLLGYICDGCTIDFKCYYLMPLPGHSIFKNDIYLSLSVFYDTSIIRYISHVFISTHTNRSVYDSWIIWMISNHGPRKHILRVIIHYRQKIWIIFHFSDFFVIFRVCRVYFHLTNIHTSGY